MAHKELVEKLRGDAVNEIGKARLEGALMVYEAYLDKQRKYYASHRDHHNEYQREYKRKKKEVDGS